MSVYRIALATLLGFALSLSLSLSAVAQDDAQNIAQESVHEAAPTPQLDEIVLKNGSVVLGTVTGARKGVVTVKTDFAGTLKIAEAEIVSMKTHGSLSVQVADSSVYRDRPIRFDGETMTVTEANGNEVSYPVEQVLLVNPQPWEMGEGFHWTGGVSFAWVSERGNSDTDELDYKIDSVWQRVQDRFTLRFHGQVDEANKQKSADNWTVLGKYDYFLDGPWYVGANVSAEQDQFEDLDLRYYIGPYVGRKFYTAPIFSMDGELGLAYVNEDFVIAEDDDYLGANWNVAISSNYLGGDSRLYVDHIGIWNLNQTEDVILNTTFGIAFPLLERLEGAAEILYEYDSGAVEGIDDLDQTYRFRIGYTW